MVKLLSPRVPHRTEVGGIAVVPRASHAIVHTVEDMAKGSPDPEARFLIQEHVTHDSEPGAELLLGVRWSPEFGVVVTLALGGATTEALSAVVVRFFHAVRTLVPDPFTEVEINPLVFREGRPVALDALVRVAGPGAPDGATASRRTAAREGLAALLRPRTLAVVGASARGVNPGRVILRNVLAAGMEPERVTVVKPGMASLDGCRCVPDVASLEPVDMLVVSVAASDVPAVLEAVVACAKARGVVLTSGGLGEGGTDMAGARKVQALLARPGAPVLNGGNCLGIRSVPGSCDTLFIPPEKLGFPSGQAHRVALVSQSGASAISRTSALPWLNPRFIITVGNQLDATLGEWVEHLVDEPDLDVVGCYVEGFRPGDGLRFLKAARAHRAKGRTVLLYRGGRTPEGQDATASHTASMAGDPAVTKALAEAEGVLIADTVDDFGDLLALATRLHPRRVDGTRAALVSNAGFECVAMADALGPLERAALTESTSSRLAGILRQARVAGIVTPNNPLDLTPVTGDQAFADAVRTVLEDPGVDVGVVGCVPMTPSLQTLPAGTGGGEDVRSAEGVAARLVRLWHTTEKAWLVAVDAGPRYDEFAEILESSGVPVTRRADRAATLLGRYVRARMGRATS